MTWAYAFYLLSGLFVGLFGTLATVWRTSLPRKEFEIHVREERAYLDGIAAKLADVAGGQQAILARLNGLEKATDRLTNKINGLTTK